MTEHEVLGGSRLRVSIEFFLDKEDHLKALVIPRNAENLTEEEVDKATQLVVFCNGLLAEAQGNYVYYLNKGLDDGPERENDLRYLEVKGHA